MIRRRSEFGLFFFVVAAVVLGLATAAGAFQGSPAHGQTAASPGVTISETSLEIEEEDTALYSVVLDTEPAAYVCVSIEGLRAADLTLDKSSLTFANQNWNAPQTVLVRADHDDDAMDEPEVILTHTVNTAAQGLSSCL